MGMLVRTTHCPCCGDPLSIAINTNDYAYITGKSQDYQCMCGCYIVFKVYLNVVKIEDYEEPNETDILS